MMPIVRFVDGRISKRNDNDNKHVKCCVIMDVCALWCSDSTSEIPSMMNEIQMILLRRHVIGQAEACGPKPLDSVVLDDLQPALISF